MSSSRDFIGPYQLIRMIRSGSTTTVFEAMLTGGSDRIALKVLLDRYKKDATQIAQLKNEAACGKELDHPSVITIFDYHGKFDLPFISMQLFNARNVKQEIREDPDQLAINLEVIIRRCAEGLQHLHEHGWIHCDVKPDNFLVDEEANVKLIDFSIARRFKKKGISNMLGRSKKLQGTRSYMAPEQIRRQQMSPATDVYGYGCVLFEMLAGRPPFTGNNPDELLTRHLKSTPPSVQAANKRVNDNFAALLSRMLSKKPDDRPRSMSDFLLEYEKTRLYKAGMRPSLPAADEHPSP